MDISYLGHSCFYLQGDFSVVTDPFKGIGYPLKRVKCDYVLSSHDHFDHNNIEGVDYDVAVCLGNFADKAKEINLKYIPSYHDNKGGKLRGQNIIYQFTINGMICTHLGDLGEDFNSELVNKIGHTDILFVPIGGVYTIDSQTAYKYVTAINPQITIPMHFKTPSSKIDVGAPDEFIKKFENVVNVDNTLTITKNSKRAVYLFNPNLL